MTAHTDPEDHTVTTPELTPEQASEIVAALRAGNAIVCPMKCYPCQFGQHTDAQHTWMDEQDAAHAGIVLTGHASRAKLAVEHPCGCYCNQRADAGGREHQAEETP